MSFYPQRTHLPRPGEEQNYFTDTPGFTTHGVPYNSQGGPAPFPHRSTAGPSNVGHINMPEGPSVWVIHQPTDPDMERQRHLPQPHVQGEVLRQMQPVYLQPADPRLAPEEGPSVWVIHPPTGPLHTDPDMERQRHLPQPHVQGEVLRQMQPVYLQPADPRLAPEEGPSVWVIHPPTGPLHTGLAEVQNHQLPAHDLTRKTSVDPDMERQRHLPQPHVQGEVLRQMQPVYLQPAGAKPWLSAPPVPVFTGDGGYVTECPQMPGSLEDPHADQELYLQQLYLQDPYLKEYYRLQLYWQQLCQQHPQCLPLYRDWHEHSHTSYLSYMESYRAAFHQIRMEKAVRQKRTTQPPMRRKRKRETFPSKRPHVNLLSEERDIFDAIITKEGEVIFSEHILDLLEGIPNILDVAAEMGFSI
ncbi:uncharacterized protein LOC143514169 isoform X2 [Brachyhypopomus gauderio]|uniref:uncharacterized protein LOC143514169 isoform X2 n=1 Tax=Brachyhypopomus gauderio TaxID=698409 RepID=UPI0040414203